MSDSRHPLLVVVAFVLAASACARTPPRLVVPVAGEKAVAAAAAIRASALKPNSDEATVLGHSLSWQREHDQYAPDAAVLARLQAALRARADLNVKVIYGDWCGDSRKNTPRFVKLWRALGAVTTPITYWNVDRQKREPTGRTQRYFIRKVPTFVLEQGEKEVGRIIEWPVATLEADLLALVEATKAR